MRGYVAGIVAQIWRHSCAMLGRLSRSTMKSTVYGRLQLISPTRQIIDLLIRAVLVSVFDGDHFALEKKGRRFRQRVSGDHHVLAASRFSIKRLYVTQASDTVCDHQQWRQISADVAQSLISVAGNRTGLRDHFADHCEVMQ